MCKNAILVMMVAVPLVMTGCSATSGRYIRPMLQASSQGDTAELADLVGRGADVNALSKRGWAPLHMAAGSGALNTVEWLVGKGALVDLPNMQGQTALCIAAGLGYSRVVRFLVGAGADVHAGFPLYLASKQGYLETVQILLDAGCDPNRSSIVSTLTPAHVAAALGHADVLAALVRAGADPSIKGSVEGLEVTSEDIANANPVHREALLEALRNPQSPQFSMASGQAAPDPELPSTPTETGAALAASSRTAEDQGARGKGAIEDDELVRIDVDRVRRIAARVIAKERPELNLADYDPSYVLCLTHPDVHPFVSIVVEWLGRKPLEVLKGKDERSDRIRVGKLSVKLSRTGDLVEIKLSDAWLYRNL